MKPKPHEVKFELLYKQKQSMSSLVCYSKVTLLDNRLGLINNLI